MTKIEECIVSVPIEFFQKYEEQVLDFEKRYAFDCSQENTSVLCKKLIEFARNNAEPVNVVDSICVSTVKQFVDYINSLAECQNSPADSVFFHAKYVNGDLK